MAPPIGLLEAGYDPNPGVDSGGRSGMKVEGFQEFLLGTIRAAASPAIANVEAFGSVEPDGKPGGVILELASGGRVFLYHVHSSAMSGNYQWGEPIEGAPPAELPVPDLATRQDGRVAIADLETWLQAVLVGTRHPQLAAVAKFSERETPLPGHPYGLSIRWHNQSSATVYLWHTVPAGQQPSERTRYAYTEAI